MNGDVSDRRRVGAAVQGGGALRCRAEGLFASMVVPEGIPPKAALARRTLWLVKRSSLRSPKRFNARGRVNSPAPQADPRR